MNSSENFERILVNNSPENEGIFPKAETRGNNKKQIEDTAGNNQTIEKKASGAMLDMQATQEKNFREKKGFSLEKVVARGILGFAVASALMSSPQFTRDAMATSETTGVQSESSLPSNRADEVLKQWNEEDDDLSEQRLKAKKNLSSYSNYSSEMVSGGDVDCSINVLPEGGFRIGFSGDNANIDQIPAAFMDKLDEIKEHPVNFIYLQLLNMAAGSPIERQANVETESQNDFENFGKMQM